MRRSTLPRLTLTLAALALPLSAHAQSPQSAPRDVAPAPPVYYQPGPAVVPEYPPPRATALVEVPLEVGRIPRQRKGCCQVLITLPSLRLVRGPALDLAVTRTVAQPMRTAYLQPEVPRDLPAPPKAPGPRDLSSPQAPEKQAGAVDPAEEPAWAARLARRLDGIERRLNSIEDGEEEPDSAGDRAPAPPATVRK